MARVPFQKLTIVRLVSPPTPPPDTPEDDAIQTAHIRYLSDLAAQGVILVNGPVKRLDDARLRGMTLYLTGPEEARRLAGADPATQAGWFEIVVDEWLVRAQPKTIGDRVDLEIEVPDSMRSRQRIWSQSDHRGHSVMTTVTVPGSSEIQR